jgi:hypothetical protein
MGRRPGSAANDAGPAGRGGDCDAAPQCERPISLAELVAASAFLDIGGMLEERWLSERGPKETDFGPYQK